MSKLIVFNNISLDGYFTDQNGDMSWAHKSDPEWNEFAASNASGGDGVLVFGRVTYEMMAGFWPTKQAAEMFPEVAAGMNKLPKIVFSRTMKEATWNNTRLINGNITEEMRKLKSDPGGADMAIMGSGTIVSQFTHEGLIDEYQIATHPIIIGEGRTLFEGVQVKVPLKRTKTRKFENGCVFVCYERAG
jgi:dihydrofolate reductase